MESAQRTAWVISFYSVGLWAFCTMHILVRAFHSMKDTATPARVGAGMVGLNLTLNMVFIWSLREGGLALSTSLCAVLQVVLLLYILRGRLDGQGQLGLGQIMHSLGKTLLATSIMAIVCLGALQIAPQAGGTVLARAERLFLPITAGVIVFLGTAYLLGSEELRLLYRAFRSKK